MKYRYIGTLKVKHKFLSFYTVYIEVAFAGISFYLDL